MAAACAESSPFRARAGTLPFARRPGTEFICSIDLLVSISHHFTNKKETLSARRPPKTLQHPAGTEVLEITLET